MTYFGLFGADSQAEARHLACLDEDALKDAGNGRRLDLAYCNNMCVCIYVQIYVYIYMYRDVYV